MKKKVFPYIISILVVLLVSCLMPLLLFYANVEAIKFVEVLIFMGVYAAVSLILFFILRFTTKSIYKAAAITTVVTLIFQNIGRLTPVLNHWIIIGIFVILMVAIAILAKKLLSEEIAETFVPVIAVVLAMLYILNTVMSMGRILNKGSLSDEIAKEVDNRFEYLSTFKDESRPASEDLPNVYMIIVDEYAGFDSIKKLYDYDNSEFKNFLEDSGFTVSTSSTNYADGTLECLADVFNLEVNQQNRYKNSSEAYCQKKVSDAVIFRFAEDWGYNIRAVQTSDLIKYKSETKQYGKLWSTTADGELSIELMANPTIYAPLEKAYNSILKSFKVEPSVQKGVVKNLAASSSDPVSYLSREDIFRDNTFTLCYAQFPHQPFYYDENGNLTKNSSKLNDWGDKNMYLGQFKYCTKLLTEGIGNIIENDPDSIIILMSDHGVRTHELDKNPWMKMLTKEDTGDILCAVYNKGEEFTDINGLCGANVLTTVVNEVWGYNIPLSEQPTD